MENVMTNKEYALNKCENIKDDLTGILSVEDNVLHADLYTNLNELMSFLNGLDCNLHTDTDTNKLHIQSLVAELNKVDAELLDAKDDLYLANKALDKYKEAITATNDIFVKFQDKYKNLEKELTETKIELNKKNVMVDELTKENDGLKAENNSLICSNYDLEKDLETTLGTGMESK